MQERLLHQMVVGHIGKGTKTITFKENDFKENFAPKKATIEKFSNGSEKYVRMTYPC